mmetsp:Transcript_4704/g.4854  ORF Transcript_4704/g.4854 Transcript_4704/m.4854 type:complete len:315 (-) Transcript_4704:190-1134(-)|eukprot:CAMPEP_0119045128 /NCGR_PEP_ID=MMETSP1177-20130426/37301_1 /TAXON_ID=2985 /ORGANISM="Ochromonas sp, Strain CCMP1899" /LENGTH=314 /DNA_ID=CAMNT_0007016355 /DNA_START=42 /DNA_END=986 /DNA_ORIENTATION=+
MLKSTTFYDVKIRGNNWELPTCVLEEVLATGQKWRLYVGNAHSAVEVHDTGNMMIKGNKRIVRYVINCAFAEYPYNRLNSRQEITYANVITKDSPQPLVTNEQQRPCWNSTWSLIQLSRNEINSSEDINVLCHCVYGWNRSVSTAAIIFRLLKGWIIDSAISHMKRLKKVHVMLVYSQWAQQFIDNFPAEQLISISSSSSSSNEKRKSFFGTTVTETTHKRDRSDIDKDSTFSSSNSSSSNSNTNYDTGDIRNFFDGNATASKIQRISRQLQCDTDISSKITSQLIEKRASELSKMVHNRGTQSSMVLDLTDID